MSLRESGLETLIAWDRNWVRRLNGVAGILPLLVLFRLVSRLGNGMFWYILMLAAVLGEGWAGFEMTLRMLAAGAICLAVYKPLKSRTTRARPYQALGDIRVGTAPLDAFSFPSGHTLHAVAFTLVAIAHFPELAVVLVPFTLLVAASRVVLGLHYPSDVLAGAAIGSAVARLVLLI